MRSRELRTSTKRTREVLNTAERRDRTAGPCYEIAWARTMERETGIEPATNSLEGCDSTTELLPRRGRACCVHMNGGGGRIRTSVGRSPADLQSAAIDRSATPPWICLKERKTQATGRGAGTRD